MCPDFCRYPDGYTLLFISFHSSDYTRFHWAVYNQYQGFYQSHRTLDTGCTPPNDGYDDDDITSGEAAAMPGLRQL